jgi:hypothetical protein
MALDEIEMKPAVRRALKSAGLITIGTSTATVTESHRSMKRWRVSCRK